MFWKQMPSTPAGIHSCSVSARNPCFSKRKQARGSCKMGNVSCIFSCVLGPLPGAHQLPTLDVFPSQLTSIEVLLFCVILAEWLFVSLWYSCMMHQRFIQTLMSGHLFHGQSSWVLKATEFWMWNFLSPLVGPVARFSCGLERNDHSTVTWASPGLHS